MSDETTADRYTTLIEEIITATLKGQIRSKEIVYQRLTQEIEPGSGEIFDRCLSQRLSLTQAQANDSSDELKQAKATRILRALHTLQGEWERYQKDQQRTDEVASAAQAILSAEASQRFLTWVNLSDPNQPHSLTLDHLEHLAIDLNRLTSASPFPDPEIQQLTTGIKKGLESWRSLEGHLIEWMYEPVSSLGVEATPKQRGPWALWATHSKSPLLLQLFQTLAQNEPVGELVRRQSFNLSEWVELSVTLQLVQRGLVNWFAKQPYGSKWGVQASIGTYLTFAAVWSELARGLEGAVLDSNRQQLTQGCFQVLIQVLRAFARHPYFPLYGGIFALFSSSHLQDMLEYLNQPLQYVEGTQEKARILTLLGYSQRAVGQFDRAIQFHEQALEIARAEQDQACEIANLNHLSRTFAARKQYAEAIRYSQQALVLARQIGIRVGEAHALTNYGYSEVQSAYQLERMEPETYEMAIGFLKQGLSLSEKLEDRQCLALCNYSLGVAHTLIEQYQPAVGYLTAGLKSAQESGDLYLQGLNLAYLAEAFYRLGDRMQAIYAACLGLYQLEQIRATEWRQPAGLLQILQGQLGAKGLKDVIAQHRSTIIAQIGVDGYDHVLHLLEL
ncbi:tetratricopeptide repeat protein [Phormidium tenue FACHB-886]|nr:tetratricopeptide repeat protein [Phormidium tenue FACHB-886]